jgi:hypothetical protein
LHGRNSCATEGQRNPLWPHARYHRGRGHVQCLDDCRGSQDHSGFSRVPTVPDPDCRVLFCHDRRPLRKRLHAHEQAAKVYGETSSWISRFGYWLDTFTIRFVSEEWYEKIKKRRKAEDWEARALSDATTMNELARKTRKTEFDHAVRFTAFVSDDNIFAVMSLSFLLTEAFPLTIFPHVHPVLIAFSAGFAYAILSLILGLHYLHVFYHGVYRD